MGKKIKKKIKIFVASSIYGFEDQLTQICSTLNTFGYEVWNSHIRTVPVHPGLSNQENCLKAVEDCDCIFGIIRQKYGSGVIGNRSITHEEMKKAIELNKPRWFIAHHDIKVARELLKQYMFRSAKRKNRQFTYSGTSIMDDIRIIDLYNDTIKNDVSPDERVGHWVDEYFEITDILQCVKTQFVDINRVQRIINEMK